MNPLTPNEARIEADRFISSWKRSEGALPLAIDISQKTSNANLRYIAITTIKFQIMMIHHQLGEEEYQQIFNIMVTILSNAATNDEKTVNVVCSVISLIYIFYPPSLSSVSQFDANILAIIFNNFLDNKANYSEKGITYDDQIIELQELIFNVLSNCDLSPNFFNLLSNFYSIYATDSLTCLIPLLPKAQEAVDYPSCYSAITAFYENLLKTDPLNLDDTDDKEFINVIIQVMIGISDRLINQTSISEVEFSLSSFIMSELIDYEFDESIDAEFLQLILAKYNESMQIMAQDPEEFFVLIDRGACKYNNFINMGEQNYFWDEIYTFLNTLIDIIDSPNIDTEAIVNDEFSKCFTTLTTTNEETGLQGLKQYFLSRLDNLTEGVFFAVASCSPQLITEIAPSFAAQLPELSEHPHCILRFISKCGFCTQSSFEYYIQIVYPIFQENPTIENALIINNMIYDMKQQFINNSQEVVNPILLWLPDVDPQVTAPLINGLLHLSLKLGLEGEALTDFFSSLLGIVSSAAVSIVGEGSPSNFKSLLRYSTTLMFPSPMEPLPGDKTYIAPPQPVIDFCAQAFGRITDAVSSFWLAANDDVQGYLCLLIMRTLKSNWITEDDIPIITNWLSNVLSVNPIPLHVHLLAQVWKHPSAQTPATIEFLNSLPEMKQLPELMQTVMKFLTALSTQWPLFFSEINLSNLLDPLSSPLESIVELGLDLALSVVHRSESEYFAQSLLQVVRDGIFGNFDHKLRPKAIHVLLVIANDSLGANVVLDALVAAIPFRDENTQMIENVLNSIDASIMNDKQELTRAINAMSESIGRVIAKTSGC